MLDYSVPVVMEIQALNGTRGHKLKSRGMEYKPKVLWPQTEYSEGCFTPVQGKGKG